MSNSPSVALRDYVGEENHIKASTAHQYHSAFNAHLMPFFEEYALTAITPDVVQECVSKLSKAGLGPYTIQSCLTPLGTMLKHAVKWGYLRTSPMPFVEKPKLRRKETAFLTPEQVRALLEQVSERQYAFFLMAVMTGMRLGELLAARWKNLDWEEGHYNVGEWLYRGVFDTPKSRSSIRTVDPSPRVLDALKAHRAAQNAEKLGLGGRYLDQDLIFCNLDATPTLNAKDIRKQFKAALKAADCPILRHHDLRHTCTSLLIAQGESPKYIQKQLGHSSVQMTFDVYGHLMPETSREATRRLDKQVFGPG